MLCKGSRGGRRKGEEKENEGTGERSKEVARTAGGKATEAWVIGG
jgi:hypothetical protein